MHSRTRCENFLYVFKGGPPGRHAATSAGRSRLAASLPARAGSGHGGTDGHGEARRRPIDGDTGPRTH
jgi:hypothetical protein